MLIQFCFTCMLKLNAHIGFKSLSAKGSVHEGERFINKLCISSGGRENAYFLFPQSLDITGDNDNWESSEGKMRF